MSTQETEPASRVESIFLETDELNQSLDQIFLDDHKRPDPRFETDVNGVYAAEAVRSTPLGDIKISLAKHKSLIYEKYVLGVTEGEGENATSYTYAYTKFPNHSEFVYLPPSVDGEKSAERRENGQDKHDFYGFVQIIQADLNPNPAS